jgi:integrase
VGAGRGPADARPGREARRTGGRKAHAFRHSFTSAVLDAADGNLLIARDAGGWASAAMVDEVYGHVDVHDPVFDAVLRTVWGETK